MKIKIPRRDAQSMAQDADAILRSLQNQSTPIIDLFVRESVQNSLDAFLKESSYVDVDFKIGKFDGAKVAPYLEGIESNLPQESCEFISVSDKHTSGLDGPYLGTKQQLDQSNFHKLVFNIGKRQTGVHAGGSWGLGKTSYFQIGVGIVVYYTRLQNGEDRLVISLIENQNKKNRLLPESERGIAWWGDSIDSDGNLIPITDPNLIAEFLSEFDLYRYDNGESGTTVIIPYVKPISEVYSKSRRANSWEVDYESAIGMAIERWYNPRLNNRVYRDTLHQPYLRASVNDKNITFTGFAPIFSYFQLLYNAALSQEEKSNIGIFVRPVDNFRNMTTGMKKAAGHLAYKVVTKEELEMGAPNNRPSPLEYLNQFDDKEERGYASSGHVIVAYARKPGMILEYAIDDSSWMRRNIQLEEGDFLFTFFVPVSNEALHESLAEEFPNIESYLRATERSDHSNWGDFEGINIVEKIQKKVSTILFKAFETYQDTEETTVSMALARRFGAMLLPASVVEMKGTSRKGGNTRKVTNRRGIKVLATQLLKAGLVELAYEWRQPPSEQGIVAIEVVAQGGKINNEKWVKEFGEGIPFPFTLKGATINEINGVPIKESDAAFKVSNCPTQMIIQNESEEEQVYTGHLQIQAENERYKFDLQYKNE